MTSALNRRTLVKGTAWSLPVIASAAPVYAAAASREPSTAVEYGLFVSASVSGGSIGYTGSNNNAGGGPSTPEEYWAAGGVVNPDLNWSDATGRPSDCSLAFNGEGSFPPGGNSAKASVGSYNSTSGFWFSAPTTKPQTGTGYIAGSTATLRKGATFTTRVRYEFKKNDHARSIIKNNLKIHGQKWTKQLNGKIQKDTSPTRAKYLGANSVDSTWVASAPTVVEEADKIVLTATITMTTARDLTFTQVGTKYYGEVFIMPGEVQCLNYEVQKLTLTSQVDDLTVDYSGNGNVPPLHLVNTLQTTSYIVPCYAK